MKFLSNLGVLLLLNIICLTPVMACMAPEAQMSAAERACCHIMKNECGQMRMPASHGCCQKSLTASNMVAIEKKAEFFDAGGSDGVRFMAADLLDRPVSQLDFNSDLSASPPGDFAPTFSNLRI